MADAIRNAISSVFGALVKICVCDFHFIQANLHWIAKETGRWLIKSAAWMLRILLSSPTRELLTENEELLLKSMDVHLPSYRNYFNSTYHKRIPVELWAPFLRPDEDLSGSQPLEGYHNRMRHVSMVSMCSFVRLFANAPAGPPQPLIHPRSSAIFL